MDGWNVALLAASGFVAVTGLVRLMLARRNKLVLELREQAEAEQRRQQQARSDGRRDRVA